VVGGGGNGVDAMGCVVVNEGEGTVFRLVGALDDEDFEHIESGFRQIAADPENPVIFDFGELEQLSASLVALMGLLRLQATRAGISMKLRNLRTETAENAAFPWV
jgi:anti-anti-sigma regulatory factor